MLRLFRSPLAGMCGICNGSSWREESSPHRTSHMEVARRSPPVNHPLPSLSLSFSQIHSIVFQLIEMALSALLLYINRNGRTAWPPGAGELPCRPEQCSISLSGSTARKKNKQKKKTVLQASLVLLKSQRGQQRFL